jgi:hypothetical protein
MPTKLTVSSQGSKKRIWPVSIMCLSLMTVLGGCAPTPPPETAAQKQLVAHFDINSCQAQGGGLYKCPSVDKPICTKDYSGPLECLRTGMDGSIYIDKPAW